MGKMKNHHGCKTGAFLVPIQKALEKVELSGNELFEKSKENLPDGTNLKYPKKEFINALHCLLGDQIIEVYYDPQFDPRSTKYSYQYKYFTFRLVKTAPNKIRLLIHHAISDEDGRSYDELKTLFKKKIDEIEKLNFENWELLINKIEIDEPTYWQMVYFDACNGFREYLKVDPGDLDPDDYYIMLKGLMEDLKGTRTKLEIKYKNYQLFQLKTIETIDEPHVRRVESFNPMPKTIHKYNLYAGADSKKEDLLLKYNLKKPTKRSQNEIENLFIELISHINLQESGKNILIDHLAIGLSAQNNSIDTFHNLIYKITKERIFDKRISNFVKLLPEPLLLWGLSKLP